ncbi:hypothetical protein G3A39_44095 [Paraburkholderia aspalathi]|nr:hypothetical protein [Paraburkholderia aspalathi]
MQLFLGIDGGGTGCRATLADAHGNPLGYGTSGPANIANDPEASLRHIIEATQNAASQSDLPYNTLQHAHAVIGLAGANAFAEKQQLTQRLPFARSLIVSDSETALQGAIGDSDGAVVILGTGSVFVRRLNDQIGTIGGWGFTISDLAGGARLGRDLLEDTLLAHDGIYPASPLTHYIMQQFDNTPRAIASFARTATPGDFARYAPPIFDYSQRGDIRAKALLDRALTTIEQGVNAMHLTPTMPICLTGGLAPLYTINIRMPLKARLQTPLGDALQGALALSLKHFGKHFYQSP